MKSENKKFNQTEKEWMKVTPTHTKDWYIKWVSSVILIGGMLLNAQNVYPINLYVTAVGIAGWVIVGYMWKDRSIMILNTVALTIYLNGIVQFLWG
tara:strand:- start:463 stop:750 length:288 start_codon:yes stop_codon:yes gene_type:complete